MISITRIVTSLLRYFVSSRITCQEWKTTICCHRSKAKRISYLETSRDSTTSIKGLEKLRDHCSSLRNILTRFLCYRFRCFLHELEICQTKPLQIGSCFLKWVSFLNIFFPFTSHSFFIHLFLSRAIMSQKLLPSPNVYSLKFLALFSC